MSNPIEAIWNLFFRPGEVEKYQENPAQYLEETGLDECDPAELHELVVMAYEKGPVYQGASVNVGGNQAVGGSSQSTGTMTAPASPPPPPPLDPTLPPAEALEQTINYYVTNSTTTNVDDRDTNVDSSVNTNVIAEEGSDLELDIDNETNTASGDGAVAAGDDINAPVNTGTVDDSILADESNLENVTIGEGNQVINESAGSAIGDGDASYVETDISANGGDVDLENVNFGQGNSNTETITDSFNETNTDSFNQTDSFNNDNDGIDDSFNNQSQVGDDSFDNQDVDQSFNDESLVLDVTDEPDPADAISEF